MSSDLLMEGIGLIKTRVFMGFCKVLEVISFNQSISNSIMVLCRVSDFIYLNFEESELDHRDREEMELNLS